MDTVIIVFKPQSNPKSRPLREIPGRHSVAMGLHPTVLGYGNRIPSGRKRNWYPDDRFNVLSGELPAMVRQVLKMRLTSKWRGVAWLGLATCRFEAYRGEVETKLQLKKRRKRGDERLRFASLHLFPLLQVSFRV